MQKILTVSVAAYNVEKTLERALDSCILEEGMEELEVIVENDGSTDRTPEIAQSYVERYPDTFRLINKENGGYGTTVNRSIQEARGEFFRLLDGDDWFDTAGLAKLLAFLKTTQADLILTKKKYEFASEIGKPNREEWLLSYGDSDVIEAPIEEIEPFAYGMWVATYRTSLLKGPSFRPLPERLLYTDQLFVTYPMATMRRIAFQRYELYHYLVGTQEQSVSLENRKKHLPDLVTGFWELVDFYEHCADRPKANREFLLFRVARYYQTLFTVIMQFPASRENARMIRDLDRELKVRVPEIYKKSSEISGSLRLMHCVPFGFYWIRKLLKKDDPVI